MFVRLSFCLQTAPSTISSSDPQGLQRLMEGLVLKIHQKKMELYRETGL